MRITSVTPMKNEAPFLLEWVAYHRLIGVNDILVVSNDCTDGTDQMLERLDEMGLVRHYANPTAITGSPKHHLQMIRYINALPRLRRSDWVASFDVDEYICVKAGQGRLADLFEAVPDANMIVMNQRNFGSGGRDRFEDRLLIDQFHHAWATTGPYHRRIDRRGTKTLTHRSSKPKEWHNHSPIFHPRDVGGVRCVNGSGAVLSDQDFTKDIKSLTAPHYGFDLIQLNHYVLKSTEAFLLKSARGNANHADAEYDFGYWRLYDHNDAEDASIDRWSADVAAYRDELLSDPELGRLHRAAVDGARAQIEELRQSPQAQTLFQQVGRFRRRHPVGGAEPATAAP